MPSAYTITKDRQTAADRVIREALQAHFRAAVVTEGEEYIRVGHLSARRTERGEWVVGYGLEEESPGSTVLEGRYSRAEVIEMMVNMAATETLYAYQGGHGFHA